MVTQVPAYPLEFRHWLWGTLGYTGITGIPHLCMTNGYPPDGKREPVPQKNCLASLSPEVAKKDYAIINYNYRILII